MTILKTWIDRFRAPQCPPDENFPYGKFTDLSDGAKATCETKLDCPTPRCGYWLVTCGKCGYNVVMTTAGRPDDPNGVRLPCQREPRGTKSEIELNHKHTATLLQANFGPGATV